MLEQVGLYIGRYQQLPLIGRNAERERLRLSLLETEQYIFTPTTSQNTSLPWTSSGRKSFVLLLGEVGIGKT